MLSVLFSKPGVTPAGERDGRRLQRQPRLGGPWRSPTAARRGRGESNAIGGRPGREGKGGEQKKKDESALVGRRIERWWAASDLPSVAQVGLLRCSPSPCSRCRRRNWRLVCQPRRARCPSLEAGRTYVPSNTSILGAHPLCVHTSISSDKCIFLMFIFI